MAEVERSQELADMDELFGEVHTCRTWRLEYLAVHSRRDLTTSSFRIDRRSKYKNRTMHYLFLFLRVGT